MKIIKLLKKNYKLIFILILALILRLYHIDFQSLWLDEIYTMNVAKPDQTFSSLISEVNQTEGFPYLYFIILKILFSVFGHCGIVARFFSAFFGIASVYAIYKLGKKLIGANVGLLASLLVALSEYCIAASQEARPYTFYFFAVIVSFYYLVLFVEQPTRRKALFYGISAGVLLNTNFFGIVNLVSQGIIIAFYIYLSPKNERLEFFKNALFSSMISIIMLVPNLIKLVKLVGFKSGWIGAPTNDTVGTIFKELLGNSEMTLFIFSILFIFCFINLFNEKQTNNLQEVKANRIVFSFSILFNWLFVCLLMMFLKSYLDTSVMISRYFTSLLPVLFLIFAGALNMIQNLIVRSFLIISLVTLMWVNHDIVNRYYDAPRKSQFREVSNFLILNHKKDEPVYTSLKYWFDYYLKNKVHVIDKPSLEILVNEMIQDSTKRKPFWYVDAHNRPYNVSETVQKYLDDNFLIDNNVDLCDAWAKHYIRNTGITWVNFSKYQPLKGKNGDTFAVNVEVFENNGSTYNAHGWAYFDGISSTDTTIELFLISNGKAFKLQSQKIIRGDVTAYFNSSFDLSNSGFDAKGNTDKLQPGRYQLAINLKNKKTSKEGLMLTDKFLDKK